MKALFGMTLSLAVVSSPALARDTRYLIKISEVLTMPEAQGRIDPKIPFFFGAAAAPAGEKRGEVVVNPKTNAVGKSDEQACRWVMLSALIDLQGRARKVGANAVVGIVSYFRKVTFSSETEFECHAGGIVAGVALKGELLKTP